MTRSRPATPTWPFAFNCDIAATMERKGHSTDGVDVFIVALVRVDASCVRRRRTPGDKRRSAAEWGPSHDRLRTSAGIQALDGLGGRIRLPLLDFE